MTSFTRIHERLYPYRWQLLAGAIAGLLISIAIIFLAPGELGFVLVGPIGFFPFAFACIALAEPQKFFWPQLLYAPATAFHLFFAALGLAWPFIVLFT